MNRYSIARLVLAIFSAAPLSAQSPALGGQPTPHCLASYRLQAAAQYAETARTAAADTLHAYVPPSAAAKAKRDAEIVAFCASLNAPSTPIAPESPQDSTMAACVSAGRLQARAADANMARLAAMYPDPLNAPPSADEAKARDANIVLICKTMPGVFLPGSR